MLRREFLALPIGAAAAALAGRTQERAADLTLRIAETTWDLGPRRSIKTLAYNGQLPGPLVRARAGRPFVVDVINDTGNEDIVHWHGLHIPSDVDGAVEEGTPPVAPHSKRRYEFVPQPSGTRWYHSHQMAHRDLKKGTYTGQAGVMIIDDGSDGGAYDQEVIVFLKEYEPHFRQDGPLDVEFKTYTINGRIDGGEPVRVKTGARVLFRIVNGSATLAHKMALPGHQFRVIALDGNAVPTPASVPIVELGPGERVDAIVEMSNAGVWWLGETRTVERDGGMRLAIEYAGQSGPPRWTMPGPSTWDYGRFSGNATPAAPDTSQTLIFKAQPDGHHWLINGKGYPDADPIVVQANTRVRLIMDNQSADDHPIHLHRHTFEVVKVGDRRMSGIMKDVVVVPAWKQTEVDVVAAHPGLSLFHCHQQFHMDMGFMTMLRYA